MNEKITCVEAQEHLIQIKNLERDLQEVLLRVKTATRPAEREEYIAIARNTKITLEFLINSLEEQVNPFERLFNLREQYRSQIHVLETAKILETREMNGEKVRGFTDIEGEFQPLPTLKEVIGRLREKKELLKTKQTQGFGKIRLVPFGMSLEDLAEKHKQVLVEARPLFTARKDPNEARVLLGLNLANPMFIDEVYKNADKNGTLVYHPTSLTPENHGGYTKSEILKQRKEKHKSGWDIVLFENNVNIPKEGKNESIGGRKRVETKKSPEQYIGLLQTPEYRGEAGITPEENLVHAITELVENNEVIDEYQGNGNLCFNIGAYFPMKGHKHLYSGLVPCSSFYRGSREAYLGRYGPRIKIGYYGLRFGVRV